jgi:hypothetical protein
MRRTKYMRKGREKIELRRSYRQVRTKSRLSQCGVGTCSGLLSSGSESNSKVDSDMPHFVNRDCSTICKLLRVARSWLEMASEKRVAEYLS